MKQKGFYEAKDTINLPKQQSAKQEKIFTDSIFDRRLTSKIYKELKKLDIKKHTKTKTNKTKIK